MIEGFRLSPQQTHLWQQASGSQPRAFCRLTLTGKLDETRLQQSVQQLFAQHEALRTEHRQMAGLTLPLQTVTDLDVIWPLPLTLSPGEALTQFRQWVRSPTTLTLQVQLITITPERHQLWLKLPAMNADFASLSLLVAEIAQRYAVNTPINDEITQYIDYSEWQNELLEEEDGEHGRSHWQTRSLHTLNHLPPFITPHTTSPTFNNYQQTIDLAILETIAQQHQTTTEIALLTAWYLLLWRLSGHPSTSVLGLTINGRHYEGLEDVVGLLEKQLPLVLNLEGNETFSQAIAHVKQTYQTAEIYFDDFAWHLLPHPPLDFIPVGFAYQAAPTPLKAGSITWHTEEQIAYNQRFYLKLTATQTDTSLQLQISYDQQAISSAQVTQLTTQLIQLLTHIARQPTWPIKRFSLVDATMRQQLLTTFNQTPTQSQLPVQPVHRLFEKQVEKQGNTTAVSHAQTHLTFTQLNQQANQLAHLLQQQGVQPETPVAIYLERSPDCLVALLAVLKAGGTYVPLDLTQPAERLATIIKQAHIQHLITQQSLRAHLPPLSLTLIDLTADQTRLQNQPTHNPTHPLSLDQLAYIIFTSGSTGQPKGVAVAHRQLATYLGDIIARFNLDDSQNFATVSTFAADLGYTTLFPPLVLGRHLHIIGNNQIADAQAFAQAMQTHQIDTLKITPSHLTALLAHPQPAQVLPRRQLILGGEATPWSLIQTIQAASPTCTIYNHYGPTETTVGVITNTLHPNHIQWSHTFPIGRPLPSTDTYVFDPYLQPVPIWEPGELFIGGAQVSRGYFQLAGQTADNYIPHPFAPGKRLYRTGDLARCLPDGHIEFLGRVDHQVKLRGYRIELGDIEAAIQQFDGVQQAVVLLHEDKSDQKQLISYVTPATINTTNLRHSLSSQLPDYMIPTTIIKLDQIPLTPNGKIDRRALPSPDESAVHDTPYNPPTNPIEETLTTIWANILERPPAEIGINHDFFMLGGHSLRATQVLLQVNQAFDIKLSLRQLFNASTIALMADVVIQASLDTDEEMDDLLKQIEDMSDEEVANFLKT